MRIPRYWQKAQESAEMGGRRYSISAWGFSDQSPGDAMTMAVERLPKIREAISAGPKERSYDYFANPIREQRVEAFGPEGNEYAVVTRNGYGALVLNAAQVMFIDIDVSPGRKFLFWGKTTAQKKEEAADKVEEVARSRGLALRIYETTGGLRLAALDKLYEPDGAEAVGIMQSVGVDPLYLRLCRMQKCFRARLSPKPWRIGIDRPPFRFPERPDENPYAEWVSRYVKTSHPYRVCRLMRTVGPDRRDSWIGGVLKVHDERCRVDGRGELA